jgi:hypothetical protein
MCVEPKTAFLLNPAGFDLAKINPEFSNIGPLQQLVKDCGWGPTQATNSSSSSMLWRRVPVVVKDVAGLVPGEVMVVASSAQIVVCADAAAVAAGSAPGCYQHRLVHSRLSRCSQGS